MKKVRQKNLRIYDHVYIFIAKIFGLEYEIDSRKYRREIDRFFCYNDWTYNKTITYIKAFKHKNKTIVEIETHMPGMLIGKGGHFIDSLSVHLNDEFKDLIQIRLKECKLWHNLYRE